MDSRNTSEKICEGFWTDIRTSTSVLCFDGKKFIRLALPDISEPRLISQPLLAATGYVLYMGVVCEADAMFLSVHKHPIFSVLLGALFAFLNEAFDSQCSPI